MFDIVQSYFSIELISAAVLFALPFHMTRKGRWLFLPLCLLLALCSSYKIGGKSIVEYSFFGGFLFYMSVLAAVTAIVWICYHTSPLEAIIAGTAGFAVQHCANDLVFLFFRLFRISVDEIIMTPLYAAMRFSVMGIVYAVLYVLFARNFHFNQKQIQSRYQWILFSGGILLLVTLLYGILEPEKNNAFWVGMHIYDALCTILALTVLVYASRNDSLAWDVKTIQRMMQLQQEHYELSKENIRLINIKCHDIRKHITSLYTGQAGIQPDHSFVKEVENSIQIYDSISHTGSDSLDVILTEKLLFCDRHQIKMTCMADGKSMCFMSDLDIYSLFGNILDNAIESMLKITDKEKRVINLDVRSTGGFSTGESSTGELSTGEFLHIQEENYYEGTLEFQDGLPVTTKPDKDYHGFGMKSISMMVKKYHGEMTVEAADGIFSLNILLPIPTPASSAG